MQEAIVESEAMRGLVLDYLVSSGFGPAAKTFLEEMGRASDSCLKHEASLAVRSQVREAIVACRFKDAIELLNDIDVDILDDHADLYFELCLAHFVHVCSGTAVVDLLAFATNELRPLLREKHLESFEAAMALLVFEHPRASCPDMFASALLDNLADKVNAAVLAALQEDEHHAIHERIGAVLG